MNGIQAELFLRTLVEAYGRRPVWTDGAPWYHEACMRLGLEHHRYRFGEWLFQAMERLKDRTESFDTISHTEGRHASLTMYGGG